MNPANHHVVVVGAGFGGLKCAQKLANLPDVDVTLIDRRNFHLFQPLLYQIATGELSPANIASPLRSIFRSQKNCRIVLGEVYRIDPDTQQVHLCNFDGQETTVDYDSLVVATGSTDSYFGHDEWAEYAPGLKTIENATEIRTRILAAFEKATLAETDEERRKALTFVIVGAGPTGVELSGALSEVGHNMLQKEFHYLDLDPNELKVILCEACPEPLGVYPPDLIQQTRDDLKRLGVTLMTNAMVTDICDGCVTVKHPETDEEESLVAETIIWAAGVKASPLGSHLGEVTGAETTRGGKVYVDETLTVPGYDNLYVIGDLSYREQDGEPLPALAPVAMQQGSYVARRIKATVRNDATKRSKPFHYRDRGSMAVIGRYAAVGVVGKKKRPIKGIFAWIIWLFIHLMEITQFRNRVLILIQWGWTYLMRDRSARLMTGPTAATKYKAEKCELVETTSEK